MGSGGVVAVCGLVAHVIIVSLPVTIGLAFGFWIALGLGLRGLDLGLGLDNHPKGIYSQKGHVTYKLLYFVTLVKIYLDA